MQQGAQVVVVVVRPDGMDGFGRFGQWLKASQAAAGKSPQSVADSLGSAAQGSSDLGRAPPLVAEEQNLRAAHGKGERRAETVP